jgi:hypothetical protein
VPEKHSRQKEPIAQSGIELVPGAAAAVVTAATCSFANRLAELAEHKSFNQQRITTHKTPPLQHSTPAAWANMPSW